MDGVQSAAAESSQDRGHPVFIITSRTYQIPSDSIRIGSTGVQPVTSTRDLGPCRSRCQSVFRGFTSNPERPTAISASACSFLLYIVIVRCPCNVFDMRVSLNEYMLNSNNNNNLKKLVK